MTVFICGPVAARQELLIPATLMRDILDGGLALDPRLPSHVATMLENVITDSDKSAAVWMSLDGQDDQSRWRSDQGEEVCDLATLAAPEVARARQVMAKANDVGEWERGQTHQSLLPYLEEETAEFVEAVSTRAGDDALKKELADIFLQVLFHAEIASRRGAFDLEDVAHAFTAKLASRSPYLFDGTTTFVAVEEQERLWALGKKRDG